ncbi:MAG: tetratricopeptide repeat protein [Acidobacteriota bacterium]|nr:tetratricopeptide repeat protein [Acidobacteriota bacterium]
MNIPALVKIEKKLNSFSGGHGAIFKIAALIVLFATGLITASAQYCPSSQLNYIVRDESGKIINPAKLDAPDFIEEEVTEISYAEAEKKREGFWALGEAVKRAREQKQGGLDKETGSLFVLHKLSGACSFTKSVSYRLTLGNKTMNLVFRFVPPKNDYGEVFLVDSPPFAQGTFEIELPEKSDYYAPSLWRKTSDAAEPPAKIAIHHIRGRIIDAVTKKPIAGAFVQFQTSPPFYGKYSRERKAKSEMKTEADGRFAFERLRGDLLNSTSVAAVFVEHPDFAAGKYAEVFMLTDEQRRKSLAGTPDVSFQSRDDLIIELTPLVTVSGRIVDAKNGGFAGAENINIIAEYGKGGYLGGNLDIPRGKTEIRPQPNGTFTLRTAPGENRIYGYGKVGGKGYVVSEPNSKTVNVAAGGKKDLLLKVERDPFEISREAEMLAKQGNDHFAAGRLEDALKSFKETLQLKSTDLRTHSAIVRTYTALKRPEEAVSFYRQTVAANSSDAMAHYGFGLALARTGKHEEASAAFREAARLNPKFAEAYGELAEVYLQLKKNNEALAEATEAAKLNPRNAEIQTTLGRAYEKLNQNEEALKHFKEAVRLAPKVPIYRYNLGYVYGILGQSEAAIPELTEAVRLDPNFVDGHTTLGFEYQNLGRYEQAAKHLSDALRLDPINQYALQSRAATYVNLNRGTDAGADAEKFIATHGWKHEQSVYLALFGALGYKMDGKESEARKLLEAAAKNTDKKRWAAPVVQYLLGKMSEDNLLKLATDNDKMTEARAYIGLNLLLSGKTEAAIAHLRWVVENGNKNFHEYRFSKAALERTGKN